MWPVAISEVDRNTTHDSTNMCHRGREIDQDVEQYKVKSPLLKVELVRSKEMIEKETYNELSRIVKKNLMVSKDMAHILSRKLEKDTKKEIENSKPSVMPSVDLQNTANGHRFSPRKTSAVYEKTSPRSYLRRKPTGKIFTAVGLKWIPIRKLFDSCMSKVDCETPNGSNDDITNPYECNQTLNVNASTLNLNAGTPRSSTIDDVCSQQFRPRSSTIDDVCSHQFRPRSSMTNDVCSHQFRPRSSMTNDVCSHQLMPHSSMINDV
ncbi:hypothetical protein Tco_0743256 [Tanacetum coccineum]